MTWNYRIIAHTEEAPGENWLGIHEVYYRDGDDAHPLSYTVDAVGVVSTEGMTGMRWVLDRLAEALKKPILTDADFPIPAPIPGADDLPEAD